MQNRSHKHELSSLPLYMVVVAALHTETQSLSLWLNRRWSWCCSEIHWTPVWTDRTIYTDMHNKNNTNFVGQDSSLWNRPEQNKQDKCLGFLFEYIFLNVIYSCDANLNFSIITPVSHDPSEIILICGFASRNISYYQCWKHLCCFIFL